MTRGFGVVREDLKKTNGVPTLPTRGSMYSAGYDFYANSHYKVEPNCVAKIWTDVNAYMQNDEVLLIDVRSSMGGKFMLANTIGIIDKDYIDGDTNGNIGIFLKNISNETQYIKKGDRIAQGIFVKYLTTDNDNTITKRTGGFGSTN